MRPNHVCGPSERVLKRVETVEEFGVTIAKLFNLDERTEGKWITLLETS